MSNAAKKWLIAAAFLVVIGGVIIAAVSAYHWDFADLSAEEYKTNTHEIKEGFRNITINTDTADILFAVSDDNLCRVVCFEEENEKHSVSVKDGTLTVSVVDNRAWYDHIGFSFQSPKVTVYLPKTEYASLFINGSTGAIDIPKEFHFGSAAISLSTGDVKLSASVSESVSIGATTGDIRIGTVSVGALDLSVSTGEIVVSDVTCTGDMHASVTTGEVRVMNSTFRNLLSNGSTGDISLKNVIVTEKLSVERSTGSVRFDGADAAEIFVETDTGDVTGSLLSEKIFITETSTGSTSVPKTTAGGKCEIITSTGDIKIVID